MILGAGLLYACKAAQQTQQPAEPIETTSVTSDTTELVRVGFTATGGVLTLAPDKPVDRHYPLWVYKAYPTNAPTPSTIPKRIIKIRSYYGKNYRESRNPKVYYRQPKKRR